MDNSIIQSNSNDSKKEAQFSEAVTSLIDELNKMLGFEHSHEDEKKLRDSMLITLKTLTGDL